MTRINLIDPTELLDQHLFAEWREAPRVITMAHAWVERQAAPLPPPVFCLGSGHMTFFGWRTSWLSARHAQLRDELLSRGYTLSHIGDLPVIEGFDIAWEPSAADVALSRARLRERFLKRPGWYRLRGVPAEMTHYTESEDEA